MPSEPDAIYPAVPCMAPLTGAPIVCGGGSARLDVFARGAHGQLLHKWWDGKNWSDFASLGFASSGVGTAHVAFSGVSLACAWGKFQLDLFARGADGKLYGLIWKGHGGVLGRDAGNAGQD
jgi:hypothetical protein